MDFMKLLKSLDDFLYEVVGWLVFYPLTLLRATLHPIQTLHYSDAELMEPEEEQYTDTLSPPIFLLITLFLLYLIGNLFPIGEKAKLPTFLSSGSNLLMFRAVTFSIFPVLMSVDLLLHQDKRLDRHNLRTPFYAQCFITGPFALAVSIAGMLVELLKPFTVLLGLGLYLAALVWYVVVEIRWFASTLNISLKRATANVLIVVVVANILVLVAGLSVNALSKKGF